MTPDTSPSLDPPDFDALAASLVEYGLTDLHVHYSRSSLTSSRRWEIFAGEKAGRSTFSARGSSPLDCLELIAAWAKSAERAAERKAAAR